MALLNISAAARAAGVSRATIHRYLSNGRLSCQIDPTGGRRIDTGELLRVFGELRHPDMSQGVSAGVSLTHPATPAETSVLRAQLEAVERERDRLAADLERERAEKSRLLGVVERQALLLTDQRPARRSPAPSSPRPRSKTPAPTIGDVIAAWLNPRK